MKKMLYGFIMIMVVAALAACGNKEDDTLKETPELLPLVAKLTVTNEVEVDGKVEMSTVVTYGDDFVDDANEVIYEVWEEGKKSESTMIESKNAGEGVYTAETSFAYDGIFNIQVHVTAKGSHTMPKEQVIVGEVAEDEHAGHGEGDFHTEGFSLHFMKPEAVEATVEQELTVHLAIDEVELENADVRYEIWHESTPDQHDWADATEVKAGEYTTDYTFAEQGAYTIVVHVENDEGLHEHEEHIIDVK